MVDYELLEKHLEVKIVNKGIKSMAYSFEGWDIGEFVKGREKLLITAIGYGAGYLVTQNPAHSLIIAACADVLYAMIKYYKKER